MSNTISAIVAGDANNQVSVDSLNSVLWCGAVAVVDAQPSEDIRRITEKQNIPLAAPAPAGGGAPLWENVSGQLTGEWILLLRGCETLPEDAGEQLPLLLESVDHGVSGVRLPTFCSLRETPLQAAPFYPGFSLRLVRRSSACLEERAGYVSLSIAEGTIHDPDPSGCVHLHREPYHSVRDLLDERLCRLAGRLQIEPGKASEEYVTYLARAYEALGESRTNEDPSDLQMLSALVEAWEQVLRGLVCWDEEGQPSGLSEFFTLPITTVTRSTGPTLEVQQLLDDLKEKQAELERLHEQAAAAQQELARIRNSLPLRVLNKLASILPGRKAPQGQ